MRWRLTDAWRTQLTWSRVITHYHRDSDVFLLGVGMSYQVGAAWSAVSGWCASQAFSARS